MYDPPASPPRRMQLIPCIATLITWSDLPSFSIGLLSKHKILTRGRGGLTSGANESIRDLEIDASVLRSITVLVISWHVVLKSSICHFGNPCITPAFKMASKMSMSGYDLKAFILKLCAL